MWPQPQPPHLHFRCPLHDMPSPPGGLMVSQGSPQGPSLPPGTPLPMTAPALHCPLVGILRGQMQTQTCSHVHMCIYMPVSSAWESRASPDLQPVLRLHPSRVSLASPSQEPMCPDSLLPHTTAQLEQASLTAARLGEGSLDEHLSWEMSRTMFLVILSWPVSQTPC